jgi:hypothetical protein
MHGQPPPYSQLTKDADFDASLEHSSVAVGTGRRDIVLRSSAPRNLRVGSNPAPIGPADLVRS